MILQALSEYYTRLEEDPETDIAPFGFSRQKISFEVVLEKDGSLNGIFDVSERVEKKTVPKSLIVLGGAKPSGSGLNPCVLWDNSGYMLGYKPDDKKPDRTLESFEAFRDKHLKLEKTIDDPEFSAVCRFLENWNPAEAESHEVLKEIKNGFGVFRIQGQKPIHHVHENETVQKWWVQQLTPGDSDDTNRGQCLVTGDFAPLARLHEPKIKGVWGAQSSGATIVSFNFDATTSYGKEQSYNSPVSERAAFQYCTALNRLLMRDSRQRIQVGDASTVFWTEKPTQGESVVAQMFDSVAVEDEATKSKLHAILESIRSGKHPPELGEKNTKFYVLGLSPNAARISIRFWFVSTLGEMLDHLKDHFSDLEMKRSFDHDPEFPSIWQILKETARETKDIPPLLGGSLIRAILYGSSYPALLAASVMRRIRADSEVDYLRAAILKAWLNRNSRHNINPLKKEIAVTLDIERPEPAYHMGRLFASLEKAQEDALPGINATIMDRYFSAASSTPASVFPRLIRLSQHHLGKLEIGSKIYHEKIIQQIFGNIDGFPTHLNLKDQGLFAIGYYHQRQDFFTKKSSPNDTQEKE